jgi:type IV pilus assembly protein PilC
MEYRCRLGTSGGQLIDGVYVAENEAQLRRDLEEKGMLVLSVRPAGVLAGLAPGFGRRRRIRSRDFLEFNQELATLLKAGMPLVQSLDLLRLGLADPVFKPALDAVFERVKGGAQLSDAFEEQGDLVPRVYTASLLAGERSGNLEIVLRRYVAYAKLIGAVRRKTISALMYPAVLLGLAVIVVGIIVLKLVPAFSLFYSSFGAELPTSTRVIMRVSAFIREYALFLVIGLVGGVAVVVSWARRPLHRQQLDHAILGVPWVGDIARKFATSQMARTMATLLSGGIPLVQALDVASRAVSNRYIAHELESMAQRVREGESLAGTMRSRRIFPDVAVKMTEVGEATGA